MTAKLFMDFSTKPLPSSRYDHSKKMLYACVSKDEVLDGLRVASDEATSSRTEMTKLKALASLQIITSFFQEAPTCARCELLSGL